MRSLLALLFLATSAAVAALHAQTLDVRAASFADPQPGNRARHGEVVLGQTTLTGSLRMFADLLGSDSIKVARGHQGNPALQPLGTVWQVGAHQVRPHRRLDLGPDWYVLYFDENERLIAAITRQTPAGLTREKLAARHPSLQRGRRWYGGDQPRGDEWTVALGNCVTLSASVLVGDERVEQLSYVYTCPTQPSPRPTAAP
jgi:hypothetical protein